MERFYTAAAGGVGRSVLELACGTGRFAIPLAASGADVTATDLSELMLTAGRRAAARAGVTVDFLRLDMRRFALGRRFQTIVIAANSLMHLHSHAEFAGAFSSIRAHLEPGGQFVFDVFVPSTALLSLPAGQRQPVGAFLHPRLGNITVEETIAYDPVAQISRADWYWSTSAQGDFRHTRLELRQIFPQELPLLLSLGGLRLQHRFGDFDRTPMTPQSWRQVCIAVAAE
jgi:SAM-dependent methyltransferase